MTQSAYQLNRRSLLKALSIAGIASTLSPSTALAQITPEFLDNESMDLSFVRDSGYGPFMDAPYIEEHFVPLHQEIPLPAMDSASSEYQNALSVLKEEFDVLGVKWRDEFELRWTYQHYGVPDAPDHAQALVEYSNSVQSYLYRELNGLKHLSLNWEVLKPGQEVTGSNRALVGKYTYFVLRVNAVDGEGNVQEPYLVSARPVERAIHFISSEQKVDARHRLIYIIQGATSLVSPFSEMIHLSTHAPAMRYASELRKTLPRAEAKNLARSSGETITESAAVMLAMNYLEEIHKEDYTRQIIRHANSLNAQLPQFSGSIAYMQKYGVQAAFDAFSEDPKHYMTRIAKMG